MATYTTCTLCYLFFQSCFVLAAVDDLTTVFQDLSSYQHIRLAWHTVGYLYADSTLFINYACVHACLYTIDIWWYLATVFMNHVFELISAKIIHYASDCYLESVQAVGASVGRFSGTPLQRGACNWTEIGSAAAWWGSGQAWWGRLGVYTSEKSSGTTCHLI